MNHLVRYRTASGDASAEEVGSLDEAVRRVEELHNEDHAVDVHVYVEVPLRVETVVKVSVAADDGVAEPEEVASVTPIVSADVAPIEPPPGAMPLTPVVVGGSIEPDHDEARKGLFNRA